MYILIIICALCNGSGQESPGKSEGIVFYDYHNTLSEDFGDKIDSERAQMLDKHLRSMKEKNLKLMILSMSREKEMKTLKEKLEKEKLIEHFDEIHGRYTLLSSNKMQEVSEKADAMENIASHYGISKDKVMLIDDGEDHIEGAREKGFRTFLVSEEVDTLDEAQLQALEVEWDAMLG